MKLLFKKMQELPIEIKTLSSLKSNNSFYEKLIKTYYEKLKVVSDFSNREDFIKEEIKRIEGLFIQPFQITIGGFIDSVDFSKFIKIAFDYLKQGMDLEIEKFVKQGQNEYRDFTKLHSGIDLTNSDLAEVKTSVIHSLEKGIGFLLYQTYLKKQLEAIPESKQIEEKKAEMSLLQIWDNDKTKVSIIKEAMKDLAIVNQSSEREITGFIDGCKDANALPKISATDLMKAIYHELGKEYNDNSKPRYDKATYTNSLRRTKEYFKI